MLAAAAIENPEAPERKVRLNAEENSLTSSRGERESRGRVFVVDEDDQGEESAGGVLCRDVGMFWVVDICKFQ